MQNRLWLIIIIAISICLPGWSQQLSLGEVIQRSRENAIAARRAHTQKETAYWEWRSFQSNFRPQLSLGGNLPGFTRSFVEVVQPDGTIAFNPISINNSALELSLSQSIAKTGGTIFMQKQVQRFDDFDRNNTLYNGIPFAIGISQPLFRFNPMKWDKQIEPLRYAESQQAFAETMEEVALTATTYYFDLLLAQINLQIAEKNLSNNDTLYRIAQERLTLGKISQNDLLQLRLGVLTAQKDLSAARQQAEVATLQLRTYIGDRGSSAFDLDIPAQIRSIKVDGQRAIQEAYANRSDATAFKRRLLEATRDVDKAKGDNGLNASMSLAFGFSNRGKQPLDIYRNPQDREFAEIQFNLPIMDWGRSKSRTETAKANMLLTQQTVEQDKLTFEQEIFTQVTLIDMLQEQAKLTAEADAIASERYQIAQDRFLLSDLSITDLSIALQEKDRAKRDFILALRDYWRVYYTLRWLTLYDFENMQKIQY